MTQDERWEAKYNEVKNFVITNKRRPSKYAPEERNAWNWLRHNQKMYNNGCQGGQVSVSRHYLGRIRSVNWVPFLIWGLSCWI
jgi:hypothetical protein